MANARRESGKMDKIEPTPQEIAEAHWKWLESLLHKIYVDSFLHGWKHGQEEEDESK